MEEDKVMIDFGYEDEVDLDQLIAQQVTNDDADDKKEDTEPTRNSEEEGKELGEEEQKRSTEEEKERELLDKVLENLKKEEEGKQEPKEGEEAGEPEEKKKEGEEETPGEGSLYDQLMEVIKQEQLLYIPDDFEGELDENKLRELKQQTYAIRDREILSSRRAEYQDDPYKLAVFDYFFTAPSDADLPTFIQEVNEVKDYQSIDISKEDNQKEVIEQYLKEGLDPSNPAHVRILSKIGDEVEDIINKGEGEETAKEAKQYFIDKRLQTLEERQAAAEQARQEQIMYEQAVEQQRQRWHENFYNSLDERTWDNNTKQQVLEEYHDVVEMEDGSEVPVWYAKEMMIKSDPQLYQEYLSWLSRSFDLEKGRFVNSPSTVEDEVKRTILELANKKSGSPRRKSGGDTGFDKRGSEGTPIEVDPLLDY